MFRSINLRAFLPLASLAVASLPGLASGAFSVPASYFSPAATVITFETGTTLLPTVPGVTFEQTLNIDGDATFSRTGQNQFFGNQYFGNFEGGTTATGFTSIAIDFATPQQAVGGYVNEAYGYNIGSLVATVYNAAGTVTGQTTTNFATSTSPRVIPPVFVGFADPSGISRIVFSSPNAGFFGVDNVTFQSAAIPEPSSLVLLGTAAATGLGVWGQKRRIR